MNNSERNITNEQEQQNQPKATNDRGRGGKGRGRNHGRNNGRPNNNGKPSDGQKKNDASFYLVTPSIRDAVANIPFSIFPGTKERANLAVALAEGTFTDDTSLSTPGTMRIGWVPTYGSSVRANVTALNTASKALYTYVRHQNSGHANYESSDLMLYLLAMDNIYIMYHEVKRALQIAKQYEIVNRNIPDGIAKAIGIDIGDAQRNYAVYRSRLNLICAKISALAVPNVFNIFKRHTVLSSVILTDSDSLRAQYYVYSPTKVLVYNPTQQQTGGGLDPVAWTNLNSRKSPTVLMNQLESALNTLLADEDINIMSGDLLKAFGRENLYILKELDEYETCPVMYDQDMLQQIENTAILPADLDVNFGQVTQSNNLIAQNLKVNSGSVAAKVWHAIMQRPAYFNSHKDTLSTDDVIEFTRNCVGVGEIESDTFDVIPGSEVFTECAIMYMDFHSTNPDLAVARIESVEVVNAMGLKLFLLHQDLLSKFDWHPIIYLVNDNALQGYSFCGTIADFKKYTLLSNDQRVSFNEIAIMGELGALILSKYNSRQ